MAHFLDYVNVYLKYKNLTRKLGKLKMPNLEL